MDLIFHGCNGKENTRIFFFILKTLLCNSQTLGNAVIYQPTSNTFCLELLTKGFLLNVGLGEVVDEHSLELKLETVKEPMPNLTSVLAR